MIDNALAERTDLHASRLIVIPVVGVRVARQHADGEEGLLGDLHHALRMHEVPQHLQIGVVHPFDDGPHGRRAAPVVVGFHEDGYAAIGSPIDDLQIAFRHIVHDHGQRLVLVALAAEGAHVRATQIGGEIDVFPQIFHLAGPLARLGQGHARACRHATDRQPLALHALLHMPALLRRQRRLDAAGVPPFHSRLQPLVAVPVHPLHNLVQGPIGTYTAHRCQPDHAGLL